MAVPLVRRVDTSNRDDQHRARQRRKAALDPVLGLSLTHRFAAGSEDVPTAESFPNRERPVTFRFRAGGA